MDRREYLQRTAALGVVGLGGCSGLDGIGDGADGEEPDADIDFDEHQTDGETLTIACLETDANASLVVVHEEGVEVATDDRIESKTNPGRYVNAGEDWTTTVTLDESADAVPLQSGSTITVALVDGSPLLTRTATVE